MSSLADIFATTTTARWYDKVRQSPDYSVRLFCYRSATQVVFDLADESPVGAMLRPPSLRVVAEQAHHAPATLYKWWGPKQGRRTMERLAGAESGLKPSDAFIDECKVVTFWPYRQAVAQIATDFNLGPLTAAGIYFRAVASWVENAGPLTRCGESLLPSCVAEDLAIFANHPVIAGTAEDFSRLALRVAQLMTSDTDCTPLGALNSVRGELAGLGRRGVRTEQVVVRAQLTMAELIDQLIRGDQAAIDISGDERARLATASAALLRLLESDGAGPTHTEE